MGIEIFHDISPLLHAAISPRAKRLALRLDTRKRRINLVIPRRVSIRMAYQFAYDHRDWIEDKLKTLPASIPFVHNMILPIMGRNVRLNIMHDDKYKLTKIELTETELTVRTRLDDFTPRLVRYLKTIAHAEFLKRAEMIAEHIDKRVQNLSIKDMHTRWGSCSPDGRMTLSWRLIFAPEHAFDYVIAHEVAHLKHHDHSARFWNLCASLAADFDGGHKWMKDNGNILLRYG